MKIRKIKQIQSYKSFVDFSWEVFCKDKVQNSKVFGSFNVIFGENGSGKSSLCTVLKNLTETQDFQNTQPALAEVEVEGDQGKQTCKFENGSWDQHLQKNSILFFDVDFVNSNVHTHGIRGNALTEGAHTQKAGKLIIDLDERANQLKSNIDAKKTECDAFNKENSGLLKLDVSDDEKTLFTELQSLSPEDLTTRKTEAGEERQKQRLDLDALQKFKAKNASIKAIVEVHPVVFNLTLTSLEGYAELLGRKLKERSQNEADEKIKVHFEKHKTFIAQAKDQIPADYHGKDCPLCMQPLDQSSKVIEFYRAAFDQTYENEKRKFLLDLASRKEELELIVTTIGALPARVNDVFSKLEKFKADFDIPDLYNLEEKEHFVKSFSLIGITEIQDLIQAVESSKKLDREDIDISPVHTTISKRLDEIKVLNDSLSQLLRQKNELIVNFKNKYSNQSNIDDEITKKNARLKQLDSLLNFLSENKLENISKKNQLTVKKLSLAEELKKLEEELENYMATTIPTNVIAGMKSILERFNLSFSLEHVKPDHRTNNYPFTFRVKDNRGNVRELKNGLSEGERQLISLAFFFATNENLPNKTKTALVFDDPITSLDSPNLKVLADLIVEKTRDFSQVTVFTHHPLFFKYLSKCENPNPEKFGILKNHPSFGGSFIFYDPGFELLDELKKCSEEIKSSALSGNLQPEAIALKYGQLLRLAIEKFIKNDLLMWDKEKVFNEITENLKASKNKLKLLTDDEIDVLNRMFKYCNYSNLLHADKEIPSALSELTTHIDRFIEILNRIENPIQATATTVASHAQPITA